MNAAKHGLSLILTVVVVLVLLGFGLWMGQPHDAQAGANETLGSYLPAIFSVSQGLTGTPSPTKMPTATSTPTQTPTSTPTPTPTSFPKGPERLVFDLNREVTESDRGFPRVSGKAMLVNDDWTSPINYAEGTLYFRSIIRGMPKNQKMRLQFCIWQRDEETGVNYGIENCGAARTVEAASDPVTVAWKVRIDSPSWYKKDGRLIEWWRKRFRYAVVIRTADGCPVSDYEISESKNCPGDKDGNQEIWAGEDPSQWYPMDMRFTVVSVPRDDGFSGWDNYPD